MECFDRQEVGDVRSKDAPTLHFEVTQIVRIDVSLDLFSCDWIFDGDARLIAPVFSFGWHNKTPPKIRCGIIPEGVIYFLSDSAYISTGIRAAAHHVGSTVGGFYLENERGVSYCQRLFG